MYSDGNLSTAWGHDNLKLPWTDMFPYACAGEYKMDAFDLSYNYVNLFDPNPPTSIEVDLKTAVEWAWRVKSWKVTIEYDFPEGTTSFGPTAAGSIFTDWPEIYFSSQSNTNGGVVCTRTLPDETELAGPTYYVNGFPVAAAPNGLVDVTAVRSDGYLAQSGDPGEGKPERPVYSNYMPNFPLRLGWSVSALVPADPRIIISEASCLSVGHGYSFGYVPIIRFNKAYFGFPRGTYEAQGSINESNIIALSAGDFDYPGELPFTSSKNITRGATSIPGFAWGDLGHFYDYFGGFRSRINLPVVIRGLGPTDITPGGFTPNAEFIIDRYDYTGGSAPDPIYEPYYRDWKTLTTKSHVVTGTGQILYEPVEWWPYANSKGDPVWDTTTGEQLCDPTS